MSQTTVLELERRSAAPPRVQTSDSASALHLGLLALSIFLSAFLLFQVQPLISRWILPWFGGSTAVWTTCMLFFQVTLFAGYAYAHVTSRWLGPQRQGILHVILLLAACLLLPIVPQESWKPTDSLRPTGLILGLLTVTVGLPYFVLSSTGPLLQSWFARGFPGRSPYRLYALSNVGSLLALLSYPFFVEPMLPLPAQAWGWSIGFAVLTSTIGYCAWKQIQTGAAGPSSTDGDLRVAAHTDSKPVAPSLGVRAAWLLLPALASVMLLATTNHVCQNVAVIPLLWIAPLSLYLLTFIVSFDHPRWYRRGWLALGTATAAFLAAGADDIDFVYNLSIVPELMLYLLTMFGVCLLCHGELARLRPRPEWLTEFYLLMSAGGALGGALVSLVAPVVFSSFYEWRLSVVGTLCLGIGVLVHELATGVWSGRAAAAVQGVRRGAVGGALGLGAIALVVAAGWQLAPTDALAQVRNFYGVITLDKDTDDDDPAQHHMTFRSGRIVHGRQYVDPAKRRIPLTYYHEDSGVGLAIKECGTRGPLRVAVVGLGTGTLATYARPGDRYRFYEINPAVTRAAYDWFTYLADCRGEVEVVDGDARLVLEREQGEPYDMIVLDAFSGDSVPVHLLTKEAFAIYRRRLRPDGMIAVNVLNHHLQLSSEVDGQADALGLGHTRIVKPRESDRLRFSTDWILISADAERLRQLPSLVPQDLLELESRNRNIPLWTDHYSNLIDLLTDR